MISKAFPRCPVIVISTVNSRVHPHPTQLPSPSLGPTPAKLLPEPPPPELAVVDPRSSLTLAAPSGEPRGEETGVVAGGAAGADTSCVGVFVQVGAEARKGDAKYSGEWGRVETGTFSTRTFATSLGCEGTCRRLGSCRQRGNRGRQRSGRNTFYT